MGVTWQPHLFLATYNIRRNVFLILWLTGSFIVSVIRTCCHPRRGNRWVFLGKALTVTVIWEKGRGETVKNESSNVKGQRRFENRSPPEWDAIQTHFRCHCSSLQQLIPWITQLRSAARLISCWVTNLFPSILDYYLDSTRWVYWWPFCFLILSERISVQYHRMKNDTTVESSSTQRYLVPGCHIFHKYTPTNLLHDPFMDQSPPPPKAFSSENHNCSTRHLFPPRSPELMTLFLIWTPPYFPPALRANA